MLKGQQKTTLTIALFIFGAAISSPAVLKKSSSFLFRKLPTIRREYVIPIVQLLDSKNISELLDPLSRTVVQHKQADEDNSVRRPDKRLNVVPPLT